MSKRKKIEIEKFDEGKITALLKERYAPPEWAFFGQMSSGTGANYSRIADGFAMNLYPSKGLQTVCFEIKISRADYKNELKDPKKHIAVSQYCDAFYIVTTAGLLDKDELPEEWGLIEVRGAGHLHTVKKALINKNVKVMDRSFIASILRRSDAEDALNCMMREYKKKVDDMRYKESRIKVALEEAEQRLEDAKEEYNRKMALIQQVEETIFEVTGVRIKKEGRYHWNRNENEMLATYLRLATDKGFMKTFVRVLKGLSELSVEGKELIETAERVEAEEKNKIDQKTKSVA